MSKSKQEVAFSNRYLYYYASLLKKIYGFVIKGQDENQPDERYIGRLDGDPVFSPIPPYSSQTPHIMGRLPGTPEKDEIVLFRFRKRLLIGACQTVLSRAVSDIIVLSEDGRRLRFHHTNLVYLTGISTTEAPLKAYATAVRSLSNELDLCDVWEIAAEASTSLSHDEISDLFWYEDINAMQWLALHLHLNRACPYFHPQQSNTYTPYDADQINTRRQQSDLKKNLNEEREEFIHAMTNDDESIEEHTLTHHQHTWLDQIQQYALWGRESKQAKEAQLLITAICKSKKNRQKSAVKLLIRNNIWDHNQNLDLLRSEVPTLFSHNVIRQTESLTHTSGNRKKQDVLVIHHPDHADIALSFRRPLFGGPEFGVHIPDLSALIPRGSDIDREAAERMAHIAFPDHPITMLPTRFSHDLGNFQPNQSHPSLSIYWRMTKDGRLKDYCITQMSAINTADLSSPDVDDAFDNTSHPQHRAIQFFSQLSNRLQAKRQTENLAPNLKEQSLAFQIAHEFSLLAGVAVGRWCNNKNIPAIYATRDPIQDSESILQISHPVVRAHEFNRQTPGTDLTTIPDVHHGCGLSHYCPITQPTKRYTDLVMQRQIDHYLHTEQSLYTADDLNTLRYRMWETESMIDGLVYRHTHDLMLQTWENQIGREFRAVVLHPKVHGVVIQLLDHPFVTVIYPGHPLEVGDEIDIHLTGIDRWKGWAHFTPNYPEPQPRP